MPSDQKKKLAASIKKLNRAAEEEYAKTGRLTSERLLSQLAEIDDLIEKNKQLEKQQAEKD